jgi:ankyrin repeat protein
LLFFHKFLLLEFFMGPSFSYSDYQLMLAVSHGDDVQAEVALKNGADPNHLGLANETQLMMASQNGDVKSAEVLLKHGAKPDLKNEVGYTALMIASQFYRPEIDKMAKVLLEHGANPNLKADSDDAKSMGTEGYTALMIACRGSTFEMVQILLDHGADPRCVGADGKTALDIAKQRSAPQQREPMVKLLEQKLK